MTPDEFNAAFHAFRISMAAVELFFPQIYGGHFLVVAAEFAAIFGYVALSVMAARERPG